MGTTARVRCLMATRQRRRRALNRRSPVGVAATESLILCVGMSPSSTRRRASATEMWRKLAMDSTPTTSSRSAFRGDGALTGARDLSTARRTRQTGQISVEHGESDFALVLRVLLHRLGFAPQLLDVGGLE